jgi:hypothetical protein
MAKNKKAKPVAWTGFACYVDHPLLALSNFPPAWRAAHGLNLKRRALSKRRRVRLSPNASSPFALCTMPSALRYFTNIILRVCVNFISPSSPRAVNRQK